MFDTIKLRERHEERHKDGEVFSCETCGRVFKNEKNLTHHIKIHHVKKDEKAAGKEAKGGKQKASVMLVRGTLPFLWGRTKSQGVKGLSSSHSSCLRGTFSSSHEEFTLKAAWPLLNASCAKTRNITNQSLSINWVNFLPHLF